MFNSCTIFKSRTVKRLLLSCCLGAAGAHVDGEVVYGEVPQADQQLKSVKTSEAPNSLAFEVASLDGKKINLAKKYHEKVVLIVNVASECGLTPQYEQLQALHEEYAKEGLAILGFPCNQFGQQEPGSSAEIQTFCTENYGVKFDMFAKVEVNGENATDLYKHLTKLKTKPAGAGKVSWNFEKFLIDRSGNVIARFGPRTKPNDPEVIAQIRAALN